MSRAVGLLAVVLRHVRSLFHLDLSGNAFDSDDAAALSEALRRNHTLMGLHYEHNLAGYVDAQVGWRQRQCNP